MLMPRAILFLLLLRADLNISAFEFNFPPQDSGSFSLQGNASYTTNGVWLTPDPRSTKLEFTQSIVGRFVFTQMVQFIDDTRQPSIAASFSTSFTFQIITTADYGYCGDGLAFFIAPHLQLPAYSSGEYLGLANGSLSEQPSRHLFAVEFDTYQNSNNQDPSSSHIGIDVDSLISIATYDTDQISELYLYRNYTFTAWVDYDAPSGLIEVRMTNSTSEQRPEAPILSMIYPLSTVFKKYMYVGFSAATGASYEGHVLYSWNFSTSGLDTSPAPAPIPSTASMRAHSPSGSPDEPQSPHNGRWKVGLGVGLGTFLVVGCILCTIFSANRYHKLMLQSKRSNEHCTDYSLHQYGYRELHRATQGFSDELLLGQGAFSRVYKAIACGPDKSTVAVKRLNMGLGKASFPGEARIISSIRHRNLLQLLGWCCENGEAMLVSKYMANGSLDRHLFGQQVGMFLSCDVRFNILLGVAAGLEYLHEGLGECVLHRDIKAANVLLDDKLQPLLGDFGLARLVGHDQVVTITAAGTPGYVAPEVAYTGKANDRSDVYSFGVLALEVACGRRVMNLQLQPQETSLLSWVWLLHESNQLMDALDPTMVATTAWGVEETQEKWRCVLHTALVCCHPVPHSRPKMQQVHQVLKEVRLLPLPRSRPNHPYSNEGSALSSGRSRSLSHILSTSGVPPSFSSTKAAARSPLHSLSRPSFSAPPSLTISGLSSGRSRSLSHILASSAGVPPSLSSTKAIGSSPLHSLSHPSFSAPASVLQSDSSHVELQPPSRKVPRFTP